MTDPSNNKIPSKFPMVYHIHHYITNMNRFSKIGLGVYFACSLLSFTSSVYLNGRNALLSNRSKFGKLEYHEEYKIVSNNLEICSSLFESLIFPYTLVSNSIPYIIIKLNS